MQYQITYVWNAPTAENLSNTEDETVLVDAESFEVAVEIAARRLAAQEPPRANMYIDIGMRRCQTAWVHDRPDGRYTTAYIGWRGRFKNVGKDTEWYVFVDAAPKDMRHA